MKDSWAIAQSSEEIEELRNSVRMGQLFAVQDWITARKPLHRVDNRRQSALSIAVEKGFHSMVEVLAPVWPDPEAVVGALHQTTWRRRTDLVWILLREIRNLSSIQLGAIAECNDKELMRFFLDRWDQLDSEDGLVAILECMPRPLIGMLREYAPRLPNAQEQLALAMKIFISEKHPRWIGYTLWMGGNPRLRVTNSFHGSQDDDPEEWMSPLEYAVMCGNVQAIKLIKPSSDQDDLDALLKLVHFFDESENEVAEYLVERGATINNMPNGGSGILDWLFRTGAYGRFSYERVEYFKAWIARGARWVPSSREDYKDARACLKKLGDYSMWKFVEYLSESVEEHEIVDLCTGSGIRGMTGLSHAQTKQKIAKIYRRHELRNTPPRIPTVETFVQKRPRFNGVKEIQLTRKQLYEKIWSRPFAELCAEFCIDVDELRWICQSNELPRPPSGHWQKVATGKRPQRPPLPASDDSSPIVIKRHRNLSEIRSPAINAHLSTIYERLRTPNLTVHVAQEPDRLHPLIVQHRSLSARTDRDGQGEHRPTETSVGRLHIRVHPELAFRAERVMNALLFFLEDYGATITVHNNDRDLPRTKACSFGGNAAFGLEQEGKKLKLRILDMPYGCRASWSDGINQLVEHCFADFAVRLFYLVGTRCAV